MPAAKLKLKSMPAISFLLEVFLKAQVTQHSFKFYFILSM